MPIMLRMISQSHSNFVGFSESSVDGQEDQPNQGVIDQVNKAEQNQTDNSISLEQGEPFKCSGRLLSGYLEYPKAVESYHFYGKESSEDDDSQ